jgi:hypothetical protein
MIALIDFSKSRSYREEEIIRGPTINFDFPVDTKKLAMNRRCNLYYFNSSVKNTVVEATLIDSIPIPGDIDDEPGHLSLASFICDIANAIVLTYPNTIIRLMGLNNISYQTFKMLPKKLRSMEIKSHVKVMFTEMSGNKLYPYSIMKRREHRLERLMKGFNAECYYYRMQVEDPEDICYVIDQRIKVWDRMSMLLQAMEILNYRPYVPVIYKNQPSWIDKYNEEAKKLGLGVAKSPLSIPPDEEKI